MRTALAGRPPDARGRAAQTAIECLLAAARERTRRTRRRRRRSLGDRWRGTAIEHAYQSLHAAEVFLVDVLPGEEVDASVPDVLAKVRTLLDRDDPRRTEIDHLPQLAPGPVKRAELQNAMRIAYEASDQLHVRVRDFRNVLLVSALLITVLMALFISFVWRNPDAVPLCFTAPSAGADMVCPTGDNQQPSSRDALLVAGLGLLGGAIAAAFAIRNIRGTSTPYGIPIALALLKIPSGALTGAGIRPADRHPAHRQPGAVDPERRPQQGRRGEGAGHYASRCAPADGSAANDSGGVKPRAA
jgi:hypothetical protein